MNPVETGLYYLQSRYYDPVTCRFINADGEIAGVGDVQGYNMFQYCYNNPVNMSDPSGNWPKWAKILTAAVAVVAVVAAVAVVTVATCGLGTVAASVAIGAAIGSAVGVASGAAVGAYVGHKTSGTRAGTLNGMAKGALIGSVTGALVGAGVGAAIGLSGTAGGSEVVSEGSSTLEEALTQLDKSGIRPGQTEISRSRVMEIVNNYNPLKAQSSVYSDTTGRYLVEGHHTTVASTILGKGTGINMNIPTQQFPSATNIYWAKRWYEFGKTTIKIIQ